MSNSYEAPVRVPAIAASHSALLDDDMYYSPLRLALGYLYKHIPSKRLFKLIEIINHQAILVQDVENKEIKLMATRYFANIDAFLESRGFNKDECIGDDEWTDMQNRYHAVLIHKEYREHNSADVREKPLDALVNPDDLSRWVATFKTNYVRANLLERHRTLLETPSELSFINTSYTVWAINDYYLNKNKFTIEATVRMAKKSFHNRRLYELPTDYTLRKLIANLPDIKVMNKRGYKGEAPVINYPLGVIPKAPDQTNTEIDYYEEVL